MAASLLAVSLVLGGYLWWRTAELDRLQADLLGRVELQRRQLERQPADLAFYPHRLPAIEFTLNPYLPNGEATLWGDGAPYPVNALGLRGPPVEPKRPGRRRILLLGDSVVFGWRLSQDETLASRLQEAIAQREPATEVVAVAVPGWNPANAAAFVAAHWARLGPDVLVLVLVANDWGPALGVASDGGPAGYYTRPGGPGQTAVPLNALATLDMPAARAAWNTRLAPLLELAAAHSLPLLVLNYDVAPATFRRVLPAAPGLELLAVPAARRGDRDWPVRHGDQHPSAAAVTEMAAALAAALGGGGDPALLAAYRLAVGEPDPGPAPTLPIWAEGETLLDAVLIGLDRDGGGWLEPSGVAYLQAPAVKQELHLVLESAIANSVVLTLASPDGAATSERRALAGGRETLVVALPDGIAAGGLLELRWAFDAVECQRPDLCPVGRLLALGLR